MQEDMHPRSAGAGRVNRAEYGWRLELPAGSAHTYRLAQLDDYGSRSRSAFLHSPPYALKVRARLSAPGLPGTWGFGLWNDPFGLSLGFGGSPFRLPALPQAAWFFHASPPNWLALRDDLPAQGFFAGTIRSSKIPTYLLAPALLALPLCAIRPISRWLRRIAIHLIRQGAASINLDVSAWHEYRLDWLPESCTFFVDGDVILKTDLSPRPPLGLVIWIDNQFACWTPEGRLGYGTLENPVGWMEVENLAIQNPPKDRD